MHDADSQRPSPDAILAGLQREELQRKSGKLFIFLGMSPGVGKTYAMLQTALQRKSEGLRVLAGIVETHGRTETASLVEGLDVLPRRKFEHRGFTLEEFDIDGALKQRPDLLLVDELAHTNAPGSRHAKRYQDVLEVVDAGIDVYTTLNVQHIESQVDIVQQISGVTIQETVPDSILDRAHEIQLIDLSVEKLLERMAEGKVYTGERANTAVQNFFKEGNLTALREMALRFTAERVDRDLEDIRRAKRVSGPWKTNARLMVGVGPSPYSESLIRWTRRAAARLGCPWLVIWVEGSRALPPADEERLARALGLARKLGAEVISATGEDVAGTLLQIARERNVTQIVVGKPGKRSFFRGSRTDRIIDASGDIDICVVRPQLSAAGDKPAPVLTSPVSESLVAEYSMAVVITFALVALGRGAVPYTGYAFVGLVFLLAVIVAALRFRRGPVLAMAALTALSWNYFFIEPLYTFYIGNLQDMLLFGMFFIVALSMGHLTTRLRQRELAERQRQKLTAALLRVTQSAALSAEPKNGLAEALRTINELLRAETALVARNIDRSLPDVADSASTFTPSAKEWGVINWSYQNKQAAGRFTDTLPQSAATWIPLQTSTAVMGVLGVKLRAEGGMDFGRRQAIEAFALQLALVLEKEHFVQAITHVEVLAHSERLQRTLLDSVSHELKTPLAIIQVSLEALADLKNPYLDEIQTASRRLQRVVNNLLQMTRIESSAVQPVREWCLADDLVQQTCEAVGESLAKHPLTIAISSGLPFVNIDPGLFIQATANILHNAAVYAPEGTPIEITAKVESGDILTVRIADQGPGLPEEATEKIFQKFYRAPGSPAGGTGLGLSIARALIRSLGGDVTARNRVNGGAEFIISVPVETLPQ